MKIQNVQYTIYCAYDMTNGSDAILISNRMIDSVRFLPRSRLCGNRSPLSSSFGYTRGGYLCSVSEIHRSPNIAGDASVLVLNPIRKYRDTLWDSAIYCFWHGFSRSALPEQTSELYRCPLFCPRKLILLAFATLLLVLMTRCVFLSIRISCAEGFRRRLILF